MSLNEEDSKLNVCVTVHYFSTTM